MRFILLEFTLKIIIKKYALFKYYFILPTYIITVHYNMFSEIMCLILYLCYTVL